MAYDGGIVAVLMGGRSAEHDVSLMSGGAMRRALFERGYPQLRSIYVSRENMWSVDGRPSTLNNALDGIDVALLAFHGEWGEDGRAQALLEWFGIPYNGSRASASAVAMDKPASRYLFREHGLRIPQSRAYAFPGDERLKDCAQRILQQHELPFVVKPAARGSSVGISIVKEPRDAYAALKEAFRFDWRILVEEHLRGVEVSCGVLEEMSGKIRALPPAQIVPPSDSAFFDFAAKYSEKTLEVVPADLSLNIIARVNNAACAAHDALGCRHYSRTDMIVVDGEPVVLELNTLPGMTPESIFPKEARAAGISFPELVDRFVALAARDRFEKTHESH